MLNPGGSFVLTSQTGTVSTLPTGGTLNITGGTVNVHANIRDGGGTATSTVTLNGGRLNMNGFSLGGATPLDALYLQSGTLENVGQINNGDAIAKTTSGTLVMAGNNTYTGATAVNGGVLQVSGQAVSESGTGSGDVTVNAGGTLSGDGRVGGNVFVADQATAVLYPHSGGVLTVGGNVTLAGSSTARFDLTDRFDGANDQVVLENRTLTCSGTVTIRSAGTLDTVDYVLFDVGAGGTIAGTFDPVPLWSGTTPKYAAGYRIVTVGTQVVLHYTQLNLTVTATANTKVYDGTTLAAARPTVTMGVLAAGDVGVWTETYSDKDVGTNKTLSPSGFVRDAAGNIVTGRYFIDFVQTTNGTITPRPLTVTATAANRIYDGTDTVDVTLADDRIPGDDVVVDYSLAYMTNKNAGTGKTVTVTGLFISGGADRDNYYLKNTTVTTRVNIARRPLTVTATAANKVYDGTTRATAVFADDRVAGDVLTVSGTAAFVDKNVGIGKTVNVTGIAVSGTDALNYLLQNTTAATTADIAPKPLVVTGLTANSKLFDGTTAATLTGTAKLLAAEAPGTGAGTDGRPYTGDAVSLAGTPTGSFSDPAVGYLKPVTVSGLALTGAGAANYTLAPLTLSASIFDGNPADDPKRL